jgi:hypothetical protein
LQLSMYSPRSAHFGSAIVGSIVSPSHFASDRERPRG